MKLHVNLHNNYMFYNINYFKKSLKTHFPNSSSHFSTPLNNHTWIDQQSFYIKLFYILSKL